MTVTGPLRDRYGTVTGVPLMSSFSLLNLLRNTTSVKIDRYGTVTGPLRDRYGDVAEIPAENLTLFLGSIWGSWLGFRHL